jgi:hypothetical protein
MCACAKYRVSGQEQGRCAMCSGCCVCGMVDEVPRLQLLRRMSTCACAKYRVSGREHVLALDV